MRAIYNFSPREKTRIYKKVLGYLKPRALEIISDKEIREVIDTVSKGVNSADLATAIRYGYQYCEKCGECCRRCNPIVLADEDINLLGSFLGNALQTYVVRRDSQWQLRQTKPCAFLRGNLCRIYDYRPFVCRTFPFTPINDSDEVTIAHYSYCKFALNIVCHKAVSSILLRITEKEDPTLHKKLKSFRESIFSRTNFKDLNQTEAISRFLKIMENLERDLEK